MSVQEISRMFGSVGMGSMVFAPARRKERIPERWLVASSYLFARNSWSFSTCSRTDILSPALAKWVSTRADRRRRGRLRVGGSFVGRGD